jgi:hypothetical protein
MNTSAYQARLEDEVWVAVNGPELVHCESIVREAMAGYWHGRMHFVRRSNKIKSYIHSEAIDSLVNKPARLPFMV